MDRGLVFGKFELPHMGCYLARHFVRGFFLCCGYFPELDEGLSWLTMNEMSQHQMVFFRLIRMSPSVLAHELRCRSDKSTDAEPSPDTLFQGGSRRVMQFLGLDMFRLRGQLSNLTVRPAPRYISP